MDSIPLAYYEALVGRDPVAAPSLQVIAFSRDRPFQLDALLRSYAFHVQPPAPPITVLYKATSQPFADAYLEVQRRASTVHFLHEADGSFRTLLLEIMSASSASHLLFLVDDDLFLGATDLSDFLSFDTRDYVPSLRLGTHLRRCYTMALDQPLPPFLDRPMISNDHRVWHWSDGCLDWAYPLSLDGHIFSQPELLALLNCLQFSSPNSLEGSLQTYNPLFLLRYGICYSSSKLVNIPWNRVQDENGNLHGTIDTDTLLRLWENGFELAISQFCGIQPESCHQELELVYDSRT